MSTINHDNIAIEGVPYSKIIDLFISHAPNTHGRAKIVGEVPHEVADDFVQRVDETFGVNITTTAEGQPSRLFYGVIAGTSLERLTDYSLLTIDLETVGSRLDAQKENRTFQSTTKTYSQILNSLDTVQRSSGTVQITVTDKPIGALIMQYTETDWEFIIRMAAQLGALAFENIIAKTPQVYIQEKSLCLETSSLFWNIFSAVSCLLHCRPFAPCIFLDRYCGSLDWNRGSSCSYHSV